MEHVADVKRDFVQNHAPGPNQLKYRYALFEIEGFVDNRGIRRLNVPRNLTDFADCYVVQVQDVLKVSSVDKPS